MPGTPIPRADCYDDKGYAEGPPEAVFTFRGTALRRFATVLCGPAGIAVSPRERRAKQRRERAMRWPVLRPVVRGTRGAVGAGTPLVTEAAMRTFHGGGNAVDAGIASLFAGAVSEFSPFRIRRRSSDPDSDQGRQGVLHPWFGSRAQTNDTRVFPEPPASTRQ